MTNGEMFKEVFGYDLYCKECHDGWRNYEYKGSVHYHFDPKKGRYINDNPPFISLSVIEKIRTEITQYSMQNKNSEDLFLAGCGDGAYHALAIIDKAVGGDA